MRTHAHALILAALLAVATAVDAQSPPVRNPEADALRAALTALQQEQQTIFQQFQMVQGLRASDSPPPGAMPSYTPPATPPNYEDVVRDRDRATARQSEYQTELQRLYARYRELEEQKRPLLERLAEIATGR